LHLPLLSWCASVASAGPPQSLLMSCLPRCCRRRTHPFPGHDPEEGASPTGMCSVLGTPFESGQRASCVSQL
jgi:hypothetical protein